MPDDDREPTASSAARPGAVGDLAVVLHSHMPYVEGFGTWPFGEEWLFDAFARSHLPVLDAARDMTLTVTPVLADQLEDDGVAERMRDFLREHRLGAAERDAADGGAELRAAAEAEAGLYGRALERLGALGDRPLEAFAEAQDAGRVELMASAATHAVLPLIATAAGRRLQIDAGLRSHTRRFGSPRGFWLPECAYRPGLDGLLAERGLDFFCVDQSAGAEGLEALTPIRSPSGPVAFGLDWDSVALVWSKDGYPADPAYLEYHRQSINGMRLWSIGGEPYDPEAARARAARHASDFAAAVAARLDGVREARRRARPGHVRDRHRAAGRVVGGGARLASGACRRRARARGSPRHAVAGARRPRSRRAPAARFELGRGQGPLDVGFARGRRHRLGGAQARAAAPARAGGAPAEPGGGAARRARAVGGPVERLGVPGLEGRCGGVPVQACGASRRGDARGHRLRRGHGSAHAQPRTRPQPRAAARALGSPTHEPSADPLLGVPAADRGRAGSPRAQALREPRRARDRGPRADPWRGGVPRRGARRRGPHPPRPRAEPPARPRRVRRLGRAHELRHARRGSRARRPLRLRPRPWPRLARRLRLRPPRAPLLGAAGDDDPRHRARPPPGLGRKAPPVLHPRRRALDHEPLRPRDRLLVLHARADRRHLRRRGRARKRHPQRDRSRGPPTPGRRRARAPAL